MLGIETQQAIRQRLDQINTQLGAAEKAITEFQEAITQSQAGIDQIKGEQTKLTTAKSVLLHDLGES